MGTKYKINSNKYKLQRLLPAFKTGYFNYVVYFYIFTATSNLFIPIFNIFRHIFMYMYTYFHVYLYLFLHISTYLVLFSCISLHIFMYISTYFYIFCHKSVAFYHSLAQKCGIIVLQ